MASVCKLLLYVERTLSFMNLDARDNVRIEEIGSELFLEIVFGVA